MSDTKQLETEVLTVPEKARALKIVDNDTYALAGNMLVQIKGLRKQINASFDPIINKAYQAHREAVAQKKKVDAPLVEAEGIIKPALRDYDTKQEQIRRQAEQEAHEAAHKAEVDRKIAEAVAMEQQGDNQGAEQVISEPVYIPPIVLQKTVPKVQGVSFTERWTFRVVDADKIPRSYLVPDEVKIGQVVRALKASSNIPGVEAYSEKTVSGRG